MRLAAGTGVVSTVVLVIRRTVIEEAFHTAHACPIVNHVLGRAQALLVADPVGGQRPGVGALLAFALATVFAPVGVQAQIFFAQRLQFTRLELRFGLHPDYSIGCRAWGEGWAQQSLFGGTAAGTGPCTAPRPRADRADGPGQGGPGCRRMQPGGLAVLRQPMESLVLVLRGGPRRRLEPRSGDHSGALGVLIGVADGSDLIQRQDVYLLAESVSGVGLPTLPASVTGCLQQRL